MLAVKKAYSLGTLSGFNALTIRTITETLSFVIYPCSRENLNENITL